jgi:uncharacterized membrane protein YdjX (TVP38/TMEM64 family)
MRSDAETSSSSGRSQRSDRNRIPVAVTRPFFRRIVSVSWRYWAAVLVVMCAFLVAFFVVQSLGIAVLEDPLAVGTSASIAVALASVLLLVADVFLPVPSSLVMLGNGALFGVAIGTTVSLVGSLGGAATGFLIGRRGGRLLERLTSRQEMAEADRWFQRWGVTAIIISRPLPIVAETVAIFAGASSISWRSMLLAAAVGLVPTCLLYALAGAVARSFGSAVLIFCLTLFIAGAFWLVERRTHRAARG